MFSNLILGTTALPNAIERFEEDKYEVVTRDQVVPVQAPADLPDQYMAHESVKAHIMHSGSYHLSPFSFNWNQHSRIYSIISIFKKYSNHVVLSSCRVDAIARDPGLVELINYFGSTNLTCAVEGVSEKICNFLQKSLMDEELYVGLAHIIQQNFSSVKMYYIYTGLETDEDVEEFERHLTKVDELRRMFGKPTFEMRMSFTPLLSTLGTPLQYHGSKVQRSLKTGSNALFRIKHLCARYGFGIRLSTSIASSDFAQTVEFLDRRGAGLLEYASLNGIYNFSRLSVMFYKGEEEITKKEYDRLGTAQRVSLDGKFYKIQAADRVVINKLYAMMNADALYPDFSIQELHKLLTENDGKETPELIRKAFPRARSAKLVGTKLKITQQDGEHYVHTYANGKKAHHMLINVNVDDITIDLIKDLIPIFTNGVTFNDVIEDKDAIYIFPSSHIKFHNNRHIGQDFKQYVSNRAFLFDSYCFNDALAKCVNCGACDSIQEVKAITSSALKEVGKTHFHLISSVVRDNEPHQKLLFEVRIERGKYGAIPTRWFKYALTRAVLRASDGILIEPNISERFIHSRQGYRLKQDNFKSILSGSLLIEMSFNSLVNMDENFVQTLRDRVNDYATPGWHVANIILKPRDFLLKNNLQFAFTEYRFDSRKVNGVDLDFLRQQIENFYSKDSKITYKSQAAQGRFATKTVERDFDKTKVLSMSAGIGSNRYEVVLKSIAAVEDNHPLIYLAGFLGSATGPGASSRPKGYTALYGADVSILGFYKKSDALNGANLFSAFADEADETHAHEHDTVCPACGGNKLINLVTSLPFGSAAYERDDILLSKYDGKAVCQFCHMTDTN